MSRMVDIENKESKLLYIIDNGVQTISFLILPPGFPDKKLISKNNTQKKFVVEKTQIIFREITHKLDLVDDETYIGEFMLGNSNLKKLVKAKFVILRVNSLKEQSLFQIKQLTKLFFVGDPCLVANEPYSIEIMGYFIADRDSSKKLTKKISINLELDDKQINTNKNFEFSQRNF